MTPRMRRWLFGLGGLVGVLLVAAMITDDDDPTAVPATRAVPTSNTAKASGDVPVAGLKLELLTDAHAELGESERNLFRFRPRPAPSAPRPGPAAPATAALPQAVVPSGPPPAPPIGLRFIGLVDAPTQAGRLAILSDGRGNVFYGKEGDIIEGRFRVLQVSPDVVEMSHLDGRGRQTIRLSGQ